ncbi:Piso0_002349 [Millerozyma farinosa CBS 7064]|uniref:Piso0_002349 protein n=1 Tax=Pichia sorbitophila (strain ATCC MYA-4447 / BCRC 22081 / CBS 7064 / NBRC 10061 / NRRL Y-12695) TaxID=559304 RepID=G8YCD6_PICSO|nr:Piso0_002349 [Millerozyma farinosa CBS 7064]
MNSLEVVTITDTSEIHEENNEVIEISSCSGYESRNVEESGRYSGCNDILRDLNEELELGNSKDAKYSDDMTRDTMTREDSASHDPKVSSSKFLSSDPISDSSFSISDFRRKERESGKRLPEEIIHWLSDSDEEPEKKNKKRNIKEPKNEYGMSAVSGTDVPLANVDQLLSSPTAAVRHNTAKRSKSKPKGTKKAKVQTISIGDAEFTKKELEEVNKVNRKKEDLMSEMIIEISTNVFDECFDESYMKEILCHTEIEKIVSRLPIISWKRITRATYDKNKDIFIPCPLSQVREKKIVLYYGAEEFVSILMCHELGDIIKSVKKETFSDISPQVQLVFMIEGYDQYVNKIKCIEEKNYQKTIMERLSQQSQPTSRESDRNSMDPTNNTSQITGVGSKDVDSMINDAQITYCVNIFTVRNSREATRWLQSFTYAISFSLYDKFERNASLANLGGVKSGSDRKTTFFQTMRQFKMMTEQKVEKLYNHYPSLYKIYSRYRRNDSLGKDSLEKNIVPPSIDSAMKKVFSTDDPFEMVFE